MLRRQAIIPRLHHGESELPFWIAADFLWSFFHKNRNCWKCSIGPYIKEFTEDSYFIFPFVQSMLPVDGILHRVLAFRQIICPLTISPTHHIHSVKSTFHGIAPITSPGIPFISWIFYSFLPHQPELHQDPFILNKKVEQNTDSLQQRAAVSWENDVHQSLNSGCFLCSSHLSIKDIGEVHLILVVQAVGDQATVVYHLNQRKVTFYPIYFEIHNANYQLILVHRVLTALQGTIYIWWFSQIEFTAILLIKSPNKKTQQRLVLNEIIWLPSV